MSGPSKRGRKAGKKAVKAVVGQIVQRLSDMGATDELNAISKLSKSELRILAEAEIAAQPEAAPSPLPLALTIIDGGEAA